jgi:hypothetical protein
MPWRKYESTQKRPDGNSACDNCGARVPILAERAPSVRVDKILGEPHVRVLSIDGIMVHRCIERSRRPTPTRRPNA